MGEAVVIGVGNADRGDDGVGAAVLSRLEGRLPGAARPVRLSGDDPAAVIEAWQGAESAVLVDAVLSGAEPGTVQRLDAAARPLPAEVRLPSTHALGAGAAIEMARVLGRLPSRLTLYGVEGEAFVAGTGLSPAVAAAVPAVAERILEEVAAACRETGVEGGVAGPRPARDRPAGRDAGGGD